MAQVACFYQDPCIVGLSMGAAMRLDDSWQIHMSQRLSKAFRCECGAGLVIPVTPAASYWAFVGFVVTQVQCEMPRARTEH